MRLITFLGISNYAETRYTFNGQECQTRYVAAALATFLQADEITVLATEQAHLSHAKGLVDELERLHLPCPLIHRIPSGGNTEELWQQFEVISQAVTEGNAAHVSFDITHGFRAQPFFAAAVINYLRSTLDTVPEMQAFYGEWRKDEATSSPIWDISTFIGLLNWSSALQSFMKTGHGAALAELAEKEDRTLRKTGGDARPQNLTRLARGLKAFSENIATVRVPEIITAAGKGAGSAKRVLELIEQSESEVSQYFKPLYPLLEVLKQKLLQLPADSLHSTDGHLAMLELAKLYVDYERYPEAATVLREGWITTYSQPEDDKNLLSKKARDLAEERWDEKEGKISGDGTGEFLRGVRNDIQHGGFRSNPMSAQSLIKNLDELLAAFAAKLGVSYPESSFPEEVVEDTDSEGTGIPTGYLAALTIGEKVAQGFKIVIEEIKGKGDQGDILHQRVEGRKFIVGTNDQNLIVAVRSYLAVKQSFF